MIGTRRRHAHWAPGNNAPVLPLLPTDRVVLMLQQAPVQTGAGAVWPWTGDDPRDLERIARHLQSLNWSVRFGRAHEWSPWVEPAGDDE